MAMDETTPACIDGRFFVLEKPRHERDHRLASISSVLTLHPIHRCVSHDVPVAPLAEDLLVAALHSSTGLEARDQVHDPIVQINIASRCLDIRTSDGDPDASDVCVPLMLSEVHRSVDPPALIVKSHAVAGPAALSAGTRAHPIEVIDGGEKPYICRQCLCRGLRDIRCRTCQPNSSPSSPQQWLCPRCAGQGKACDAWLIKVTGADDELAMQEVLAAFANAGAMRTDLDTSFAFAQEELGSGSNAVVHRVVPASLAVDREKFDAKEGGVIKFFDSEPAPIDNSLHIIAQEALVLAAVQKHPNIVGFHGLFCAGALEGESWPSFARYGLMMDFCGGGDLSNQTSRECPWWSEEEARGVMRDLLSALSHVHSVGFVHRDVKMENIMMASDGRAVLTDFGLACHKTDLKEMQRRCGTPGFVAPEVLRDEPYDERVDVFASGVVLYILLFARLPFAGSDISRILRRTLQGRVTIPLTRGDEPVSLSSHCKNLLRLFICKPADQRPRAAAALTHKWFGPKQVTQDEAPCMTRILGSNHKIQQVGKNTSDATLCSASEAARTSSPTTPKMSVSPLKRRLLVRGAPTSLSPQEATVDSLQARADRILVSSALSVGASSADTQEDRVTLGSERVTLASCESDNPFASESSSSQAHDSEHAPRLATFRKG